MTKAIIPVHFILAFSSFLLTVLVYADRACISAVKGDIGFITTFSVW